MTDPYRDQNQTHRGEPWNQPPTPGAPGTTSGGVEGQGIPLAAGVIALGVGWLAASLLPASQKEQELASRLEERAQPVLDDVKQQARHVAEELKEPAQQAAQHVKESATDSTENVKLEAQIQKDEVTDSAKSNAEDVRKTAQDG